MIFNKYTFLNPLLTIFKDDFICFQKVFSFFLFLSSQKIILFDFLSSFCFIAIFLSVGCITLGLNPIYSLLSLILIFCIISIYLFILKIHFLSLVYALVYIGALIILFLFLTMLLVVENTSILVTNDIYPIVNILFTFQLWTFITLLISEFSSTSIYFHRCAIQNYWSCSTLLDFSYFSADSLLFNNLLYTQFSIHFIILGFVLLIGMLGSIALTLTFKN